MFLYFLHQDKDGKDVELYVPVEISVEQLYGQGIKAGVNFDNFDQSLVRVLTILFL